MFHACRIELIIFPVSLKISIVIRFAHLWLYADHIPLNTKTCLRLKTIAFIFGTAVLFWQYYGNLIPSVQRGKV